MSQGRSSSVTPSPAGHKRRDPPELGTSASRKRPVPITVSMATNAAQITTPLVTQRNGNTQRVETELDTLRKINAQLLKQQEDAVKAKEQAESELKSAQGKP